MSIINYRKAIIHKEYISINYISHFRVEVITGIEIEYLLCGGNKVFDTKLQLIVLGPPKN